MVNGKWQMAAACHAAMVAKSAMSMTLASEFGGVF
jgi:hypothetical protein